MQFNNTYKQLAADPSLESTNQVGTPCSSVSGTPVYRGAWRVSIRLDEDGNKVADAVEFQGNSNARLSIPVKASSTNTLLIPGVTVTFGATVNNGDVFDVGYSKLVLEAV
jgi:hypothetical protein